MEFEGVEIRPVAGMPGYFAATDGRILSARRHGRGNKTLGTLHERAQSPARGGYLKVSLWVDGSEITRTVHRLVAEAFHGPHPVGMEVRHLDGDKTNNRAANLAWGTRRENDDDKIRHGANTPGTKNAMAKLNEDLVYCIKERLASGARDSDIAAELGVSRGTINNIARGIGWRHVSHPPGFSVRVHGTVGAHNPMAKLSEQDVLRIRTMLADGMSQAAVGQAMAVSRSLIGMIKNRRVWAHLA